MVIGLDGRAAMCSSIATVAESILLLNLLASLSWSRLTISSPEGSFSDSGGYSTKLNCRKPLYIVEINRKRNKMGWEKGEKNQADWTFEQQNIGVLIFVLNLVYKKNLHVLY